VVPVILVLALGLGTAAGVLWGKRSAGRPAGGQLGALPGQKPPPAAPAAPAGGTRVVLTQGQLTDLLRHALGTSSPDASVTCQPGALLVHGSYHKGPLKLPLTVTIVPYVEAGNISVYVQKAQVGATALPSDVTMALTTRMKHVLYEQQQKIKGLVLDTVEVRDQELEFTGHFGRSPTP
jgi:hypothetical protein